MSTSSVVRSIMWRQYVAASIMNILAVSAGVSIGWASPIIPQLQEDTTPVGTTPMTQDQISWLTSIFFITALVVSPLCGPLSNKFGKKLLACVIVIPQILSWILTIIAQDFACLFAARIFTSVASSMTIFLVPIYVAEIASDEIRGKLGSFLPFALSLGILLAFIFGVVMSYQMFAVCGMILPLVFISGFTFMPETPVFLLRKSGVEAATRSLLWLRHGDKAVVEEELARLKQSIEDSQSVKSGGFRDVLKNRGTIKGFLIALVLLPGQQASGNPVVFAYSATIFQLSGSSLSPNTSAIVLGAVQLAASFLPTMMIERFGRRVLLLFSCGGMAICHGLLGLFLLLQTWHYDLWFCRWAPIMLLCLFTTFYSIGLGPLAYVVVSEVLSSETRAVVNSMAMTATWIIAFLVVKGFPLLAESSIGSYGCFFAFGFSCTCTFLVTYIIIPETKGKSVDCILRELNATAIKSEDDFRGNSIEIK